MPTAVRKELLEMISYDSSGYYEIPNYVYIYFLILFYYKCIFNS